MNTRGTRTDPEPDDDAAIDGDVDVDTVGDGSITRSPPCGQRRTPQPERCTTTCQRTDTGAERADRRL
jgi:hypothetical protein